MSIRSDAPTITYPSPYCTTCLEDLEHDGDNFTCTTCMVYWPNESGGPGDGDVAGYDMETGAELCLDEDCDGTACVEHGRKHWVPAPKDQDGPLT